MYVWRAVRGGTGGGKSEGGLVEGRQRGDWWTADKEGTGGGQTERPDGCGAPAVVAVSNTT